MWLRALCGCVKLMPLSRVLAALPHGAHPLPPHQPWAMLKILSGGEKERGSGGQGHLSHVSVSTTDKGPRDPLECGG